MKIESSYEYSRAVRDLLMLTTHGMSDMEVEFDDCLVILSQSQLHFAYVNPEQADPALWERLSDDVSDAAKIILARLGDFFPLLYGEITTVTAEDMGMSQVGLSDLLESYEKITTAMSQEFDEAGIDKLTPQRLTEFVRSFTELLAKFKKYDVTAKLYDIHSSQITPANETAVQKISWAALFEQCRRALFSKEALKPFWYPLVVACFSAGIVAMTPLPNFLNFYGFYAMFSSAIMFMATFLVVYCYLNRQHYRAAWNICMIAVIAKLAVGGFSMRFAGEFLGASGELTWNSPGAVGLVLEAFYVALVFVLTLVFLKADINSRR